MTHCTEWILKFVRFDNRQTIICLSGRRKNEKKTISSKRVRLLRYDETHRYIYTSYTRRYKNFGENHSFDCRSRQIIRPWNFTRISIVILFFFFPYTYSVNGRACTLLFINRSLVNANSPCIITVCLFTVSRYNISRAAIRLRCHCARRSPGRWRTKREENRVLIIVSAATSRHRTDCEDYN